jgi:SAM-dependent methyltransferase
MHLPDVIRDTAPPAPWTQGDNIPWHDPEFSNRMLREHLSSDHDLASRRAGTIDRQVTWIHENVLQTRPARILDLCCGPGLYGVRLAARGHTYVGIDYAPASIAYASRISADDDQCTFVEDDIRRADYGHGFGLVMMLYGEFNVFCPADAGAILRKVRAALAPGGLLLLEPHTRDAVVSIGHEPRSWDALDQGLFSDRQHLLLREAHWDDTGQAATRRFFVVHAATGDVARYAVSYQAYTDAEYRALLTDHGFRDVTFDPSLTGDHESSPPTLMAILARTAD